MVLTRDDLRNQLKRGEIAPVYVLYGGETYLRDIAARTIADRTFGPGDLRDFNETAFSLNTAESIKPALAAAEQLPMMSARRVVKITDVRVSASGMRDTLKDEHESFLSAYLSNPSETSVVIFVADELNGTRKISKLLTKNSVAVEFKKLDDAELLKWARDEIKKCGSEIDERDLRYLIGSVGQDVQRLTNEIKKLSAAALPDKLITSALIESLVPNSREIDNWTLTNQMIAGNKTRIFEIMTKVLNDGAEPVMILGLIAGAFRRLALAKAMMEKGVSADDIGKAVNVYGQNRTNLLAAARRTDLAKIARIFQRISETDVAVKTSVGGGGPAGSRMQIEMLVCEVARELSLPSTPAR